MYCLQPHLGMKCLQDESDYVGLWYKDGRAGLPQDLARRLNSIQAGELGAMFAHEALGSLYESGTGVERDNKKAMLFYCSYGSM